MFTHNKFFFAVIITSLLLTACATSYAPHDWLPDTEDIPGNLNGGWITIVTYDTLAVPGNEWYQFSGEFIAMDDENVYMLYDSLYVVSKSKISNSFLELDQKSTESYGTWVALGSLATISNGVYLILTMPLWLIGGTSVASGESYRDIYESEFPDENYWQNVNKFSRFPQGLQGINLEKIKPIFEESEITGE